MAKGSNGVNSECLTAGLAEEKELIGKLDSNPLREEETSDIFVCAVDDSMCVCVCHHVAAARETRADDPQPLSSC